MPSPSPGPINFYFERKPEPKNEPEPGAEPRIELGIEPKPEVESLMSIVLRKLYTKCGLNMAQDKGVIDLSLWLP